MENISFLFILIKNGEILELLYASKESHDEQVNKKNIEREK